MGFAEPLSISFTVRNRKAAHRAVKGVKGVTHGNAHSRGRAPVANTLRMDLSTCSHTAGAGARGRGTASGRVARAAGRAGCVTLTALALILTALVSAAPAEAATLGATAAMRTTSVGVGPALEYCGNARVEDALA